MNRQSNRACNILIVAVFDGFNSCFHLLLLLVDIDIKIHFHIPTTVYYVNIEISILIFTKYKI